MKNATIHSILITGCKFVGNKAPGHGAALYIDTKNDNDDIQIADTVFDQNEGGYSVVYLEGFFHPISQQQFFTKLCSSSNNKQFKFH